MNSMWYLVTGLTAALFLSAIGYWGLSIAMAFALGLWWQRRRMC